MIVADDDGVLRRAPRRRPPKSWKRRASARRPKKDKRKRLAAGELGLDIYSMRERLAEKGLKYV